MLYILAQALGAFAFVSGVTATAMAATGNHVSPPVLLARLEPQVAAEWIPIIANGIVALGGALAALYASYRQARRKADADDNHAIALEWKARFEDAQSRLNAVTAERDELLRAQRGSSSDAEA